ncbi:NinF family protein [Enterobacter hormaechei subsp. steigerwaltii]|uniref:protein NinF n=1 Tax=Enterobacter hormaechei TaxID=158836 RepID=UPI000DCC575E|nr:protein NinF [Enterobacter hormaechei]RAY85882.1 NinF family protein [Enterobacter hormaechei subsp. steigerwaltii]
MLSQSEALSYEQQSIRRTLCAGCTKELSNGEVHCCESCASLAIAYRDPNGFMTEEDDE